MINVLFDTSPLKNGHAVRGIGMYTRMLSQALKKSDKVNLVDEPPAHLIHYPYFDLFAPTLSKQHTLPSVVTIHDVIPLVYPDKYKPGIRGKLAFYRQRWLAQKLSAIITDSEASKADIHAYLGIPESKIHVVYLAANPELKPADSVAIRKVRRSYALPEKYILYVGDINYNKNIPQLIKSLRTLDESIHLVCVGTQFYPHQIQEWNWIETQIALNDVAHRVLFLTSVPNEPSDDLAALYSGSIAYVQPSLYEGFGLPVLEAMRCHAPVVCAANSSLLEVAGQAAILTDTKGEALADGVKQVLSWNRAQRAEHIKKASTWEKRFTWNKAAKETLAVYEHVLESKGHD